MPEGAGGLTELSGKRGAPGRAAPPGTRRAWTRRRAQRLAPPRLRNRLSPHFSALRRRGAFYRRGGANAGLGGTLRNSSRLFASDQLPLPARAPAGFAYGPRPARVRPPNATDPLAPSRAPCACSCFAYPDPPFPPSSPIARQKPAVIYILNPAPPPKEPGALCKNRCPTARAVRMRPIPPRSLYLHPKPRSPSPALPGQHGGAQGAGGCVGLRPPGSPWSPARGYGERPAGPHGPC